MQDKSLSFIGLGRVGFGLASRLLAAGWGLEALFNRSRKPLPVPLAHYVLETDLSQFPKTASRILICVPDDAIELLAHLLAETRSNWTGALIAHTSGLKTSDALAALKSKGAEVLSFHPLQTFSSHTQAPHLKEVRFALEGDAAARAWGEAMVLSLGGVPFTLDQTAKARYHLAASMASNFFVTLIALVQEIGVSMGLSKEETTFLIEPLVSKTWENLKDQPAEMALTGPIVRGDVGTIAEHIQAIETYLPHFKAVYQCLGMETIRLAQQSGRLEEKQAKELKRKIAKDGRF